MIECSSRRHCLEFRPFVERPEAQSAETEKANKDKQSKESVKRVNSSGHVTLELDDIYDMAAAVREASRTAQDERPNSQTSIVWVWESVSMAAPGTWPNRVAAKR